MVCFITSIKCSANVISSRIGMASMAFVRGCLGKIVMDFANYAEDST